jgi:hypothetical protein
MPSANCQLPLFADSRVSRETRACYTKEMDSPQRLKPASLFALGGTAKAVPFPSLHSFRACALSEPAYEIALID